MGAEKTTEGWTMDKSRQILFVVSDVQCPVFGQMASIVR